MPTTQSRPVVAAPRGAMPVLVATLVAFLAASSAPTPLYRVYQEAWGFSAVMLTVVFAVYAFSLLLALLTVGALSDHLGRRPVIVAALAVDAAAMAAFAAAGSVETLIVARILQGLATGAATSAIGAALLDADHARGPLANGLAPMAGMALGALGAGALVEFAPWPRQLIFLILLTAFGTLAGLVWRLPETASIRPGTLASLIPRLRVPSHIWPALLAVSPVNLAVWALGGFYLSLMPSLMKVATGQASALAGGLAVATLTAGGTAALLSLRHGPAARSLGLGALVLVLGVSIVVAGVHGGSVAILLIGTLVAGFGWGAGFLGALRSLLPLAAPGERAGVMSAFYIESYLTMSLPAILAGALVRTQGLIPVSDIYAAILIALALAALAAQRRRSAVRERQPA